MDTAPSHVTPITFAIDLPRGRRVATFSGAITDRELIDAYRLLLGSPEYDPSLDDLIDLRGVTHMGVTGAGLHRLIALYDERDTPVSVTRNAIVAPTDVLYGVSRMFQTMRGEELPALVEVFRSMDEALRWLDESPHRAHLHDHSVA